MRLARKNEEGLARKTRSERVERRGKSKGVDLAARGEPFQWCLGGALAAGLIMIAAFLVLIFWNGLGALYPRSVHLLVLKDGTRLAGEISRSEEFRPDAQQLEEMGEELRQQITKAGGISRRVLLRTGNFDFYNEDFRWVHQEQVLEHHRPKNLWFMERTEWGPFIGEIKALELEGLTYQGPDIEDDLLERAHREAQERRLRIRDLERGELSRVNRRMEQERLALRKAALRYGEEGADYLRAKRRHDWTMERLQSRYQELNQEIKRLREEDGRFLVLLSTMDGKEKIIPLSAILRMFRPNAMGVGERLVVYFSRWWELLTSEPREANTEGGVMPAIFGTFLMTVIMSVAVAPLGVVAALFLREYARQGALISAVRIGVNNLAGVPSIVYGVFGLGFFAYLVGGKIDALFFPERLPSPTFGTGGLLWSSLTLALLTLPVVIVATEEALASVPSSMREGSLACGASRWQTMRYIVLPRAMPGILTGLILAMARGAGEVAPLMLVGVVKLAPELPVDGVFPFLHLERSFMHLAFHIFDLGFQSRNSEAAKPMVFVTTLLLVTLVAVMNALAVFLRSRLRAKFAEGQF